MAEFQVLEVGEGTEFGRYRPTEPVAREEHPLEAVDVAEFGRYRPTEPVLPEA